MIKESRDDQTFIKHLVSEDEWMEAFPVMIELRKDLVLQDIIEMLKQMTNEG